IDGLSKGAAAERLGLPADVVHGRLDRGREKLRAALARRGLAPVVVLGLLIPATAPASAELLERTVGICVGGQSVPVTIAALAAGRSVAVSPNGRMIARETCDLAADGGDGVELSEILGRQSVVIEDVVTGRSLIQIRQPDYLQRRSNLFTPDGQVLVTWTSTYPAGGARGRPPEMTTVRLWELRTGKERLAFNLPVIGEWWEFEPWGVTLSADGRLLASARPDKTISVRDLATGAEVAKRSGYRTIIDCLAFRPDGKAPASGHADGTALIWDLSGVAAATPAAMDREAAWKEPASDDAGKAYRAILALAVDPGFVAMLRERLKPVVTPPADQIRKLIADLDNATFATRQRATAELTKLGDAADDQLRAALKGDLTAEQRGRVEGILGKRGLTESDPDQLRPLRCVEVLEKSGSAEAQAVLAELAKGAAGARLTRESNDAVRRMLAGPRRQD
ncbi:MAG TPA: hypothetical protein VKE40_11415, partial [Gemmataceae bacterium]|nr:hypothetical protein [Gemmataceae bacterium]